jgi:hypothetical protein
LQPGPRACARGYRLPPHPGLNRNGNR